MNFYQSFPRNATRSSLIVLVLVAFLAGAGFTLLNADDDPPVRDFRRVQDAVVHDALTDEAPIPHDRIRASEHGDTAPVRPAPVRDTPPRDTPPRPAIQVRPHAALTDVAPQLQARPVPAHAIQVRPAPIAVRPEVAIARRPVEPQLITAELLYVEIEKAGAEDRDYEAMVLAALQSGNPMELPAGRLRAAKRLQLSGATDTPISCLWGERVSRITGTMSRSGQTTNSMMMEDVGTAFGVTARAANDGAIVLECNFECSLLGPVEEGTVLSEQDGQTLRTPNVHTMTLSTTVKLQPGEPVILSGSNQVDDDEQTIQTIIGLVVTAIDE